MADDADPIIASELSNRDAPQYLWYCHGPRHKRAGQREHQSRENCECYRLGYFKGYHEVPIDLERTKQTVGRPLRSKIKVLDGLLWSCLCAIVVIFIGPPWWLAVLVGGFFAGIVLGVIQIVIDQFFYDLWKDL